MGGGPRLGAGGHLPGSDAPVRHPGTAQRLPSLLGWEEWGTHPGEHSRTGSVPPLLCHGKGDAVTVPALVGGAAPAPFDARWLVAPDTRRPWLPGAEILLWAAVRAARTADGYRFFLPPIRMLRSTTSAGAASSVG